MNLKYNEGLTYIINDYFLTVKVVQNGGGGCYQQCKGSLSGWRCRWSDSTRA